MRLVILYDAACAVCARCRTWIESSEPLVPIRFVPCRSHEAKTRFGAIPFLVHQLVVVDEETGTWWAGSAAFVMTLWALAAWRTTAELLVTPLLVGATDAVFACISAHRASLGWLLGAPSCENGACEVVAHTHPHAIYR
jgi:predicted DCC family thiol-disulfide oxidoreductase YuxK